MHSRLSRCLHSRALARVWEASREAACKAARMSRCRSYLCVLELLSVGGVAGAPAVCCWVETASDLLVKLLVRTIPVLLRALFISID